MKAETLHFQCDIKADSCPLIPNRYRLPELPQPALLHVPGGRDRYVRCIWRRPLCGMNVFESKLDVEKRSVLVVHISRQITEIGLGNVGTRCLME